jgi:uncharacterized membrane protein
MDASFEEKSVWVQLACTLLGVAAYVFMAAGLFREGATSLPAFAACFGVSVSLIVVAMIVGHVAVALASRHENPDERDRLVAWKASHRSAWLLVVGIMAALMGMLLGIAEVWVAHALLVSLYLAQIMAYVLQLVYYRRGLGS